MSTLFDNSLERAGKKNYITGVPAINFPTAKNTGGWHFLNYFDLDKGVFKVSLSGIHYPDTTRYFGDYGLIDISSRLDDLQIPYTSQQVYIANHHRAAADILVKWAISSSRYCTVEAEEWFPAEQDKEILFNIINLAKQKLQEDGLWTKLESWVRSQRELGLNKTPTKESTFP